MSYFTQQTKVVELLGGNSVTLRKLAFGARQEVIDASTGVDKDMQVVIHVGQGRTKTLEKSIVSWEGPDFEGRPVTAENIGLLPPDIADILLEAADELQAELTVEEKKV